MFRPSLLLSLYLLLPSSLHAQAPTIDMPFPMGVQRGTVTELTLTGENLLEPITILATFPVKAVFSASKNPKEVKVTLEVPPQVTLGWHSIRLMTRRGVSNARLFCVDDLLQIIKDGSPN